MIRALVFDLDGVLVDAAEWHYTALNEALEAFGHAIPRADHERLYNGLPTVLKLEMLTERRGLPKRLHRFIAETKQKRTMERLDRELEPNLDLQTTLARLKAEGLKLGVASNSVRDTVDLCLKRLGIESFFDVVLSNQDVEHPKPDPEMYLTAMERLGVAPDECVIFEDSMPGIQAARLAGARVAIVADVSELTYEFIHRRASPRRPPTAPGVLQIVVPMAGEGRRFADAGYENPKPLIEIFGKPMIEWVIENVRPETRPHRFIFLCREMDLGRFSLAEKLERLAPGSRAVGVPSTTQGAACTVMLAADELDPDAPLLIANSDQWVENAIDPFLAFVDEAECDGAILTFPATDPKWSYALTRSDGRVVDVAEKNPISPHATVGIYWFRTARHYLEAAMDSMRADDRTNGEFYVCPVYKQLLRRGFDVRHFGIPTHAMHGLGTPEDLKGFIHWHLRSATLSSAAEI